MEYEIAILCLVLICAAYKVGRAGYEIEPALFIGGVVE